MAPRIFGFEFLKPKNQQIDRQKALSPQPSGTQLSPVPPENQDGALNIQFGTGGGYYGYYLDLDGTIVDDFQLINRYREMQIIAEVDEAVDQIINEMVIQDAGRMPVSIDLDQISEEILPEDTKIRIAAEYDGILKLMNFHKDAYSTVRQWYIDGRLYFHLVVDEADSGTGIQELRQIDPRCIRKVREVTRKRHQETQMDIIEVQREYFIFNPMGFVSPSAGGQGGGNLSVSMNAINAVRMTKESVMFCPSGLYDATKRTVLSWLHKAIKPLNLMPMMEDSCVIYRVSRAPERRVFYIDVGNLPKQKAEQYLYDIMQKYRNKLVYDVVSGDIRDDRKFMSIMEDFWLPRREGGKGTEITTLPGGQNLSEMEDVDYFRRKLYRALNLPPSRIDPGAGFNLGRASEISRDELRFIKFVHRMQIQFNNVFDQLLERQLRLKNILTQEEWERIKDSIRYVWQQDSYFEELKMQEIWTSRMGLLTQMEPYINRFFSTEWIRRNILHFTDDEWAAIREDFDENPLLDGDGMDGEEGGENNDMPFTEGEDEDTLDVDADDADIDKLDPEKEKLGDEKPDDDENAKSKPDKKKKPFGADEN